MLSCIVQVASILFLPEFFRYYSNLYILQLLLRDNRKKSVKMFDKAFRDSNH